MITLRADKKLEETLEKAARAKGMTKSEVIRQSLSIYLSEDTKVNPYKIGENLFGAYGSGKGNLSEDSEKILKNIMSCLWTLQTHPLSKPARRF